MEREPDENGPDRPAVPDLPVVVVGLMGSGKTSVAARLAQRLGRELRDSDPDLELLYGQTAAQHVSAHGVAVLHEREALHLREALAERPPPVIAAAASVVDTAVVRKALGEAFVVWLDAPVEVLAERMREGVHRPHFDPDLRVMLTSQLGRRGEWFRAVADLVVDVGELTPDEVVTRILAALPA